MKSNLRRLPGCIAFLLCAAAFTACAPQKPPSAAPAPAQADEGVDRTTAIQQAQRDAAFHYAEVPVQRVDAQRRGSYWVVELTSLSGPGLRYTISAQDGSIRQRSLFQ